MYIYGVYALHVVNSDRLCVSHPFASCENNTIDQHHTAKSRTSRQTRVFWAHVNKTRNITCGMRWARTDKLSSSIMHAITIPNNSLKCPRWAVTSGPDKVHMYISMQFMRCVRGIYHRTYNAHGQNVMCQKCQCPFGAASSLSLWPCTHRRKTHINSTPTARLQYYTWLVFIRSLALSAPMRAVKP